MKIYILGINGLLGSELFLNFINNNSFVVRGSVRLRSVKKLNFLKNTDLNRIDFNVSARDLNRIKKNISKFKPSVVINCIGYVKQKIKNTLDSSNIFYVNSVFPKKLYDVTNKLNIRLIHFSSDCVFNGCKGYYNESSIPDAKDLYGYSKYLGELSGKNVVTIRTSIIGHEIDAKLGLLEWFLSQKKQCLGFKNCYFSGLTSFEVFKFLKNYLINNKKKINGLFHLSSKCISKYDLLKLISRVYKKKIIIKKDYKLKINRVLISRFIQKKLSYKPPSWVKMIKDMRISRLNKFKDSYQF
jgi:dTDP-4-dehydrorhamnose reductase